MTRKASWKGIPADQREAVKAYMAVVGGARGKQLTPKAAFNAIQKGRAEMAAAAKQEVEQKGAEMDRRRLTMKKEDLQQALEKLSTAHFFLQKATKESDLPSVDRQQFAMLVGALVNEAGQGLEQALFDLDLIEGTKGLTKRERWGYFVDRLAV